jgi:hypothetical protein
MTSWQKPPPAPRHLVEDVPRGWECRRTSTGRLYYVDHNTRATSWMHPSDPRRLRYAVLPPGWQISMNDNGRVYFFNPMTKRRTFGDPWNME